VPIALVTFLVALAIVDDLGAVLVIAVFYTDQIYLLPLVMAGMSFQ
jgi:NhaA family Na+:H+ antiporter